MRMLLVTVHRKYLDQGYNQVNPFWILPEHTLKSKMPPRKKVVPIAETPVVFFLKISDQEEQILPVGQTTSYSEILDNAVRQGEERFSNSILKPMLEQIFAEKVYSEYTACFWCCHQFDGFQFKSPVSYNTYKDLYTCEGNFCSPECCLAHLYSDSTVSDTQRWNRHALLIKLYGSLYPDYLISPAPPRTLLRMFGGVLDIKQYREYLSGPNDLIGCEMPPIRTVFPSMNIQGPLRDIKKYVSLANEVIDKASESLRLKRTKPLQQNIQTIDMCIKR
jgi:hypothetical protein